MTNIKETPTIHITFFVWISTLCIFMLPQSAECGYLQDTLWGTVIIEKIDETANSASRKFEAGSARGIDTSIQYVADKWQTFVDQEQTIFDSVLAGVDSLGILIDLVSENNRQLKNAYDLGDTNKTRYLFEKLTRYTKEILGYISKPALLVFVGAKCKSWPNCKAGQRTMESVGNIASKFANKIRISIIDVKKQKRLAKQYKIMLTPTLVIMDLYGKEVFRKPGESTVFLIEDELNKLIGEQ